MEDGEIIDKQTVEPTWINYHDDMPAILPNTNYGWGTWQCPTGYVLEKHEHPAGTNLVIIDSKPTCKGSD